MNRFMEGERHVPEPLRQPGDLMLTAHRVSAFQGTPLDHHLCALGIDTLSLAGITTTGVVVSTLCDASDRGYRILLVEDGCLDTDAEAHAGLMRISFATRAEILSTAAATALIG
jgi:nicotinamidase-related amidase